MSGEIEYLDPEIANEGVHVDKWTPSWTTSESASTDEWQPDLDPPHINDYAAFKKHKHYGKYFRPYRYVSFPAWVYHKTEEPKLIAFWNRDGSVDVEACKKEVMKLGASWRPEPYKPRIDMTGKSLPVKNDTQRLAETVATAMSKQGPGAIDATAIAAIVAAVMAAQQPAKATLHDAVEEVTVSADADIERTALLELAEKDGVKIDKRWKTDKIKQALGL